MDALAQFHDLWGYGAIIANALAGGYGLAAWKIPRLRGRIVWALTIVAEVALLVQVLTGVVLVSADKRTPVRFHMFYGYVAFITIGLAFSYRRSMRGRLEMLYGCVGLFLVGVGIRAVLQMA